ncbi:MAG: DUF3419 family protein [Ruminococcus sp.]|nr:DUF3419 family protein [Ruminococcus sp.]
MKEDIVATKTLIYHQVKNGFISEPFFGTYEKVYAGTNENINGYMSKLDFEGKNSALTVMAGGDFALNAILNGILSVDTFDLNRLTKYFVLGIKRSAILTFDYKEYLAFMTKLFSSTTSIDDLSDMINSLMPNMDYIYSLYWQSIISYNYNIQKRKLKKLNLFEMLLTNIQGTLKSIYKNTYLISEENYNKLRMALGKVNITFRNVDILNVPDVYQSGQYDFVFLSNIADYLYKYFGSNWSYRNLEKFKSKFKDLLAPNGTLALAYLISCYKKGEFTDNLILNSSIKKEDLTTEEILLFPHLVNNRPAEDIKDGMILERKIA